ncbi:alpha/beta hydrolase [Agrococcus sp. 1P02AA]|uniref:alpha/beta fold hydrolase n=1 Tax=Agrococcus sp. 1P02AA TaxID=3132259 RepID=UPI0039A6D500
MEAVVLGGVRTTVRRWGSGVPTVVIAHSAGLDAASSQWFGAALAERGVQAISIDLRGHGASMSRPEDVSLDSIAHDLAELPAALGLDQPHFVGTSLGGVVGSLAVRANPSGYRSMTIVCSPDRGHPAFVDRAARAEAAGMGAVTEETLERWFTVQQLADSTAPVDHARAALTRMRTSQWSVLWRDFANFSGHPALGSTLPVHCIAGALDQSTPPAVMERVAADVGGTLEVIDGAPHQALMTHANVIARLWAARNA